MSFKFIPKTEAELQAENLCGEGLFPFTILESSEVESKSVKNSGKTMIKLKLNIHGDDGGDYHVYDYVADWFMGFKLRHLAYAVGIGPHYEAGTIDASGNSMNGLTGYCNVGIQKAKDGFPAKNTIQDYQPQKAKEVPEASDVPPTPAATPTAPAASHPDDDVPF